MIARPTAWLAFALLLVAAASSSCAPDKATPAATQDKQFEFGARRVRVTVPTGWEALDQGQQKRFRKGELEIVLEDLGSATPPPRDFDELIDWGLAAVGAAVGHDQGREVKSRHPVTIDGREAMDIETWSRLDHANPQRIVFVSDDGDLLALHTVRMAFADSLAAFDAIRDSLHFVSARRSIAGLSNR
jgi:hypothetical protein